MRRQTLALSALALVTTLSACSGHTSGTARPAGDQGSDPSVNPVSSISALVSQASGSMDKKQTFALTIEISGGAMKALPTTECKVDRAKTMMSCDGAAKTVVTEKAMYVNLPTTGGSGKPWRKITFRSGGMMAQAMGQMGTFTKFTDFTTMLPEGSTITDSARERVDGKQATRYEVTVDLTKSPEPANKMAEMGREIMRKSGISELHSTIWISGKGLPLKVTSTVPPMTVMGRQVPETTTTVTYSDWGKPVTITVPPASKVGEGMPMPKIPGTPN